MAISDSLLLPKHQKILLNPEGKIHPLVQKSVLRLVAWLVSGKTYLQRECQNRLLALSQIPEGKVLSQITNRPGESGLAGVMGNKLIPLVAHFFADLFHTGLEYSTIDTHRSSISAVHDPIEGFSVGKHPKVCNLLTVVFNKRPPKPKYCFVWDVEAVLKYLTCLPPNDLLSTKMLTLKLAMLLALTSASRCSEIKNQDINYLTKSESKCCFNISKPT